MDLLPPRWVDIQDDVTELLSGIAQKSARLDKLHQKHVLPGFEDEDARKEEEGVIEQLTQEITRAFHDCQRAIQRIETMVKEQKQHGGVSKSDEMMAKNIQISLASRVQEASAGFRKKQSTYLKSMPSLPFTGKISVSLHHRSDQLIYYCYANAELRSLDGMTTPLEPAPMHIQNPYMDPSLIESDADKSYSQSTLLQTSQKRVTSNDAAIIQREREINDIARGIIELSDIFRDLQAMIIDQGTMLDRIDFNVERMMVDVKAADKDLTIVCLLFLLSPNHPFPLLPPPLSCILKTDNHINSYWHFRQSNHPRQQQATNYQRRSMKRKILLLLILLVVGMFIILLVKPKRSGSPAPAPAPQPPASNPQQRQQRRQHRRAVLHYDYSSRSADPFLLPASLSSLSPSSASLSSFPSSFRQRRSRFSRDSWIVAPDIIDVIE